MSTGLFFLICKQSGLDHSDLDRLTISMCLDHIDEYVELNDPKRGEDRVRKATQEDMDMF